MISIKKESDLHYSYFQTLKIVHKSENFQKFQEITGDRIW